MQQELKTTTTKPLRGKDPLRNAIDEIKQHCKLVSIKWCNSEDSNDAFIDFLVKDVTNEDEVKSKLLDYLFYVNGSVLDIEVQTNEEYVCYRAVSEFLEVEDI